MDKKNIIIDKNNKAFRFNVKLTYILVFISIVFFFYPKFLNHEGTAVGFFLYFIFSKLSVVVIGVCLYQGIHIDVVLFINILFDIVWIISVVFFFKTFKFSHLAKKYLFYCINQILYSGGLLFYGIWIYNIGYEIYPEIANSPREQLKVHMIIGAIAVFIAIYQMINFLIILKKDQKSITQNG